MKYYEINKVSALADNNLIFKNLACINFDDGDNFYLESNDIVSIDKLENRVIEILIYRNGELIKDITNTSLWGNTFLVIFYNIRDDKQHDFYFSYEELMKSNFHYKHIIIEMLSDITISVNRKNKLKNIFKN